MGITYTIMGNIIREVLHDFKNWALNPDQSSQWAENSFTKYLTKFYFDAICHSTETMETGTSDA